MQRGDHPSDREDGRPPAAHSFEGRILSLLPDMRRYCRSLARTDADGEDLFQDSLERALNARASWGGANLRGWLFTITTNLYRNGARRERRFPSVDLADAADVQATDTYGDPLQRSRMMRALNALSADHRAVLMLVVVEGYSYAEVAAIMECPLGTVMSRLSRAREELARQLTGSNVIPLRRPE